MRSVNRSSRVPVGASRTSPLRTGSLPASMRKASNDASGRGLSRSGTLADRSMAATRLVPPSATRAMSTGSGAASV